MFNTRVKETKTYSEKERICLAISGSVEEEIEEDEFLVC